jgi:head-tail adaptor
VGVNAGNMDREIVMQTATPSQSGSGEVTLDWPNATEQTLWAEWLPAGTREAWQAQQRLGAYVDGVFKVYDMSPRPDPATTRIQFDGRVFDVRPYIEIGRGDGLLLPVSARA